MIHIMKYKDTQPNQAFEWARKNVAPLNFVVENSKGNYMKDIYTLTLSFPYDEDDVSWSRTIEVKEDFSLIELHEYIQEIVEFDNDHLYEFFAGRNPRNRAIEISTGTRLNEIYPLKGYKLYYLFDFGDNWLFQINKSRKKKNEDKNKKYPTLIESKGENPEQYPDYEEWEN